MATFSMTPTVSAVLRASNSTSTSGRSRAPLRVRSGMSDDLPVTNTPVVKPTLAPGGMRKVNSKRMVRTSNADSSVVKPTTAIDKELIKDALTPTIEAFSKSRTRTEFVAETLLPTTTGNFRVRAYRHWVCAWSAGRVEGFPTEPMAIIYGDVEGLAEVPVRVHDACFTSEVLGSLKCDCDEQLKQAMQYMKDSGPGIVVYLQQEGRGIGLANKIAAYSLQQQGLDTVDANRALDLPDDCREYSAVKAMLDDLNVQSIKLMTNNPRKIEEITKLGVNVTGRIQCLVEGNEHSSGYLEAKMERMAHMMDHLE